MLAGGPMAQAEHFLPQVQAYVDRYAFRYPKDRIIPVLRAERSDHAGVLGAVALVMQAAGSRAATPTRRPLTSHAKETAMTFARTVLGDIDARGARHRLRPRAPRHPRRPAGPALPRLRARRRRARPSPSWRPPQALGLRTVVDAMPADCGRDVLLLAEVSRRSGVHVIAPTRSPPRALLPRPPLERAPLRRRDRGPLRGRHRGRASTSSTTAAPIVKRTAHRAGVMKIAGIDGRPERARRARLRGRGHRPGAHRLPHPHPLRGGHRRARAGRGARPPRRRPGAHRALATSTRSSTAPTSATSPPPAPGSSTTRASAGRPTSPTARCSSSSGRPRTACSATSRSGWTPPARATGRSTAARPAGRGCSPDSLP